MSPATTESADGEALAAAAAAEAEAEAAAAASGGDPTAVEDNNGEPEEFLQGRVKTYSTRKGFGFLHSEALEAVCGDVFVFNTHLVGRIGLVPNEKCEFALFYDPNTLRPQARNVRVLPDDVTTASLTGGGSAITGVDDAALDRLRRIKEEALQRAQRLAVARGNNVVTAGGTVSVVPGGTMGTTPVTVLGFPTRERQGLPYMSQPPVSQPTVDMSEKIRRAQEDAQKKIFEGQEQLNVHEREWNNAYDNPSAMYYPPRQGEVTAPVNKGRPIPVGSEVTIIDFPIRELCGAQGVIKSYDDSSCRYRVKVEDAKKGPQEFLMPKEKLRIDSLKLPPPAEAAPITNTGVGVGQYDLTQFYAQAAQQQQYYQYYNHQQQLLQYAAAGGKNAAAAASGFAGVPPGPNIVVPQPPGAAAASAAAAAAAAKAASSAAVISQPSVAAPSAAPSAATPERLPAVDQIGGIGQVWYVRTDAGDEFSDAIMREGPLFSSGEVKRLLPGDSVIQSGLLVRLPPGVVRMPVKNPNGWVTVHAKAIGGPTFLELENEFLGKRAKAAKAAARAAAGSAAAAGSTGQASLLQKESDRPGWQSLVAPPVVDQGPPLNPEVYGEVPGLDLKDRVYPLFFLLRFKVAVQDIREDHPVRGIRVERLPDTRRRAGKEGSKRGGGRRDRDAEAAGGNSVQESAAAASAANSGTFLPNSDDKDGSGVQQQQTVPQEGNTRYGNDYADWKNKDWNDWPESNSRYGGKQGGANWWEEKGKGGKKGKGKGKDKDGKNGGKKGGSSREEVAIPPAPPAPAPAPVPVPSPPAAVVAPSPPAAAPSPPAPVQVPISPVPPPPPPPVAAPSPPAQAPSPPAVSEETSQKVQTASSSGTTTATAAPSPTDNTTTTTKVEEVQQAPKQPEKTQQDGGCMTQ